MPSWPGLDRHDPAPTPLLANSPTKLSMAASMGIRRSALSLALISAAAAMALAGGAARALPRAGVDCGLRSAARSFR